MLEIAFLEGMPDAPQANVVAALLVFRLLYLILPLVFALGVVLVFERDRWRAARPFQRRPPPCRRRSRLTTTTSCWSIDLQADFMPGGALAVGEGDEIVPLVNALIARFAHVVVTQDWHPPGHASFASSHEGAKPFDTKRAALRRPDPVAGPLRPGDRRARRSIPTLDDRQRLSHPAQGHACRRRFLFGLCRGGRQDDDRARRAPASARGVRRVFACGLATDYCVAFSALDARAAGFETFVIEDACRAIDANDSLAAAWARMNAAEVWRIQSREILGR